LEPGGLFSATIEQLSGSGFATPGSFLALDSLGATLDSQPLGGGSQTATVSGTIPSTGPSAGMLVLETVGSPTEAPPVTYHITIPAPPAAVPEPSTLGLLASGLAGLAGLARLRRRTQD